MRNDLLRFMEDEFGKDHKAEPFASHRLGKERSWRLMKAKAAFDISKEPDRVRDKYGPDDATRLLQARRLVEAGVPVVTLTFGSRAQNAEANARSGVVRARTALAVARLRLLLATGDIASALR